MQIAGLSGSADITELANGHNYNYLSFGVNTTPDFLTPYATTGCAQGAAAVRRSRSILTEQYTLWLADATSLAALLPGLDKQGGRRQSRIGIFWESPQICP